MNYSRPGQRMFEKYVKNIESLANTRVDRTCSRYPDIPAIFPLNIWNRALVHIKQEPHIIGYVYNV
jgi:hypothetical protein